MLLLLLARCRAWLPVVQGRDYLAPAAWVLSLVEPQQQAAAAITHVAVWLAPTNVTSAAGSGGGRSEQRVSPMTLPAAASVTWQWVTPGASSKQQQPQWRRFVPGIMQLGDATAAQTAAAGSEQPSSSSRWPSVTLGPLSLLQPVARPAGGPMLLRVRLQGVGLLQQLLSLRARVHGQQQQQAGHGDAPPANASSDGATCWQPLVMYSSIWGGQDQVLVINTTLSSSSSVARPGLAWLRAMLSPWLVAHRKASSVPGYAAATSPAAPLAHVLQQQRQAGEVDLLLLLDPSCGDRKSVV